MPIQSSIKANLYKDSVALMRISHLVVTRTGARRVTLLMGTPGNKELLAQAGALQGGVKDAQPNDIMIVVEGDSTDIVAAAIGEIDALIQGEEPVKGSAAAEAPPRSISLGVAAMEAANLAQISVPGPYAAAEAFKALRLGLHVFLFSDNVPLDQERAIKELAYRKQLLVMGPDCGTAIIRGVPLGFANVVRRGRIGLVGASGTGLQEITCQIDYLGEGVSHALGTGSRDIREEIGGITMLQALDLLAADEDTKCIVIVSKPPSALVQKRALSKLASIGKPAVVCFLGSTAPAGTAPSSIYHAATLEEAANSAVALTRGMPLVDDGIGAPLADLSGYQFARGQRYIRGLYSGGTLCSEAQIIWAGAGITSYSNVPLDNAYRLADATKSKEHSAIDLGSDEFTIGRPHPMIDYGTRMERLLQEAEDSTVAIIVLDVVLGYGSHDDPADVLAPVIRSAKAAAGNQGRQLVVICSVCGTENDPQCLSDQQAKLRNAGALVASTSSAAAALAATIATRAEGPNADARAPEPARNRERRG